MRDSSDFERKIYSSTPDTSMLLMGGSGGIGTAVAAIGLGSGILGSIGVTASTSKLNVKSFVDEDEDEDADEAEEGERRNLDTSGDEDTHAADKTFQ